MRFLHLSDLHLGKKVNEFSMKDDQEYILNQILGIIDDNNIDGVIIAGDVYDKSIALVEAVTLFDEFIYKISKKGKALYIISGNHDSAERNAFGGRLMENSRVYMSPVYDGSIEKVTVEDEYGPINIYLMPFLKPAHVRKFFPDATIENYTDAIATVVDDMKINDNLRNLLVCHQFITGATTSDSEEKTVGGLDNVDAEVFKSFDYVALGHIHRAQKVGRNTIRYCGTPLKYSFSEINDKKSVTIVDMREKGEVILEEIPLVPLRDMRELKGSYNELTDRTFVDSQNVQDYLKITLTDEEEISNVLGVLRQLYPNIMKLSYDNKRTNAVGYLGEDVVVEQKSELELFEELFLIQNGQPINEWQRKFMTELIEELKENTL